MNVSKSAVAQTESKNLSATALDFMMINILFSFAVAKVQPFNQTQK